MTAVILFLLWCTFLVPSFKNTALIFPEIFLIECYCLSGTIYDVITFLTKTQMSLKWKKIFEKGKQRSSLLWKAFQISSYYFLLHRHFKPIVHTNPSRKRSFMSTVRPILHTKPSRNGALCLWLGLSSTLTCHENGASFLRLGLRSTRHDNHVVFLSEVSPHTQIYHWVNFFHLTNWRQFFMRLSRYWSWISSSHWVLWLLWQCDDEIHDQ